MLLFSSIGSRDYSMMSGAFLMITVAVIVADIGMAHPDDTAAFKLLKQEHPEILSIVPARQLAPVIASGSARNGTTEILLCAIAVPLQPGPVSPSLIRIVKR